VSDLTADRERAAQLEADMKKAKTVHDKALKETLAGHEQTLEQTLAGNQRALKEARLSHEQAVQVTVQTKMEIAKLVFGIIGVKQSEVCSAPIMSAVLRLSSCCAKQCRSSS
jgi:hypothetical protein